jgi:hypothetical protein
MTSLVEVWRDGIETDPGPAHCSIRAGFAADTLIFDDAS